MGSAEIVDRLTECRRWPGCSRRFIGERSCWRTSRSPRAPARASRCVTRAASSPDASCRRGRSPTDGDQASPRRPVRDRPRPSSCRALRRRGPPSTGEAREGREQNDAKGRARDHPSRYSMRTTSRRRGRWHTQRVSIPGRYAHGMRIDLGKAAEPVACEQDQPRACRTGRPAVILRP